ncbi:MAG TPA: DHA2 family efflux MFS transporter permease subunit [Azospirillum sp.]|nr:DHA2 family efflux MFS transporter permease subunit [Azospirillum sp.]
MSSHEELRRRHGARYKWLATATAMIGTFSMVVEATILNVALPDIMAAFAVGQQTAQWLVTGFLAAMTTGMLLNAWCVERFGMRATYVGAILVFCSASILGALAPSIGLLILARVAQGAAAGVIQPLGMIVVFEVFDPRERGKGFGLYGLGVVLGPAVAPMIGGFLVDFVSWRAVFLVVLPTCMAAVPMALTFLRSGRASSPPPLDIAGLALLAGTLAVLLWALSSGPQVGWGQPAVGGGLLIGLAGALAFVAWEWFCPAPLLNLRAFRSGGFASGFLLSVMIGVGLYASTYLIPLYLQQVRHLDPSAAGLVLLPAGLAMAFTFPLAGRLTDRMPSAAVALIGILFFLGSCVMLARVDDAGGLVWFTAGIVLGRIGLGLMMPPVSAGTLRLLDLRMVPQGSGAINFGRQLGGAIGVGLISVVLSIGSGAHRPGFAEMGEAARRAAQAEGYHMAFYALALSFAAALVPLWLMHRETRRAPAVGGA